MVVTLLPTTKKIFNRKNRIVSTISVHPDKGNEKLLPRLSNLPYDFMGQRVPAKIAKYLIGLGVTLRNNW